MPTFQPNKISPSAPPLSLEEHSRRFLAPAAIEKTISEWHEEWLRDCEFFGYKPRRFRRFRSFLSRLKLAWSVLLHGEPDHSAW